MYGYTFKGLIVIAYVVGLIHLADWIRFPLRPLKIPYGVILRFQGYRDKQTS